jgi:hypothetical protein
MSPTSPNLTLHACHGSGTRDCSTVEVFGPVQSASHASELFLHQKPRLADRQIETLLPTRHHLRMPSEPSPAPIKEPPNPPENPDVPVREPDPDDPAQI